MKTNKNKLIKKIGIGVALSLMTFGIGVGLAYEKYNNNNYAVAKAISYYDEQYRIQFTLEELSYDYENLLNYLTSGEIETNIFQGTSITYDVDTYNDEGGYDPVNEDYSVFYRDSIGNSIWLGDNGYDNILSWSYLDDNDQRINFEYGLIWNLNSSIYSTIKNLVELDIQANTPQQNSMGQEIINATTSGLGLISDLASEFLMGFTTLFYANNQLTDFAIFSLIFLGVAISFAVIKLILNIIRGNTGA